MVTNRDDPEVVEVVWSGTMQREGTAKITIVGDRMTKPGDLWQAPARGYTKTGRHIGKGTKTKALDNCSVESETGPEPELTTFGDEGEE